MLVSYIDTKTFSAGNLVNMEVIMASIDRTTQAASELGMDSPTDSPTKESMGVTTRGPNRKARRAMKAKIKKQLLKGINHEQ